MANSKTYGYLFEVDYNEDGPHVRYGMDVSGCVSDEYREAIHVANVTSKAAHRVGATFSSRAQRNKVLGALIERDGLSPDLHRAGIMFHRAQFTGGSLYLIKTEEPMTFGELDKILKNMINHGELRAFLEKCKV